MRFIHISDLHFGKSIHGVSLIDHLDQVVWVERFLEKVEEVNPDAVLIAGDVYDRSSPSADAVELLDHMLTRFADQKIPVFMVAGNHDSGQKLSFGNRIFEKNQIHISGVLEKELMAVTLENVDQYGDVTVWLVPYLFPALVSQKFEEELEGEMIHEYDGAMRYLLGSQNIDCSKRNIIVAHQNVVSGGKDGIRGGSESMVGGVGQIEYTAFDDFDYVALGHIHAAYSVGREEIRYAGSPLCYHFDEIRQAKKGPILVELGAKGEKIKTEVIEISPLHKMREYKGSYEDIKKELEEQIHKNEYVRIVITDQKISPQISEYLRTLIHGRDGILMELVSEYRDLYDDVSIRSHKEIEEKSMEELFSDFYTERRGGTEADEKEKEIIHYLSQMMEHAPSGENLTVKDEDVSKLLDFILGQEE